MFKGTLKRVTNDVHVIVFK